MNGCPCQMGWTIDVPDGRALDRVWFADKKDAAAFLAATLDQIFPGKVIPAVLHGEILPGRDG